MEQVYVTKSIDGQAINRLKSRFALKNKFANQIFLRVGIFSILFGLLFLPLIGEAQIQTYGTPVNTIMKENPFLDASTYFNNVNGSAGKGLVFPQTNLTLFTFKTTNLDGLLFPTAFDGMIVYNIGTGNTQAGQGVVTAVTPGFYYFSNPSASTTVTNGKWIRIANANDLGTTPSGAAFPVTANPGDVFYNTATKNYYYYKDTEWVAVSSVPSGAAAPAAGSSKVGDLYYETNANPALSVLKIFNGTAWVSIGGSSLTDGSVTASKLQASGGGALPDGGGANFVLQSNGDGTFSWLDISTGVPVDPNSLSLPTGQLYVGNGSGKAAATAKNAIPISGFGTATADVALGGFKITGLATPTLATDAATMGYVDGKVPSFVAGDANKVLSINGTGTGTVWTTPATGGITSVSVASANGFTGTSSGGATPALTLGTSVNGLVKGNGTAISAAVAGTDYIAPGASSLTIGAGANAVTLSAPTAGSGAYNLVFPTNDGTADYVLKTDGTGVLRWDVDATGAAGGGITSIGLSLPLLYNPFTTLTADGSFTGTLATQAANTVFAGPSSGGNAAPTFRALAATDIPALDWAKITTGKPTTLAGYGITDAMSNPMSASGDIVYGGASGAPTRLAAGTNGQVLTLAGGVPTWANASGGGDMLLGTAQTVTALKTFNPSMLGVKGASTGVTLFTTANGTAVNNTLTLPTGDKTLATTDQSYYLGTTSIALNRASGAQTLNGVSIDGNAATATSATTATTATNISGGIAGQILYQSAANTTSKLPVGTNGQVLTLAAGVPTWANASGGGDMMKATYDGANVNEQLVGITAAQTLTNKTIAAGSNTITGLTNANLSGTAGITDANLATISTAGKVANSATTATSTNTNSAIVARDGSGNFAAGTITATLSGNASTATNISGGTAGQILYQSAANTTSKLAVGTNGQVLTLAAGVPTWANASGGGDMLLGTAQTVTALKTFNPSMLGVKGASTGVTLFTTANGTAVNNTLTLPTGDKTLATTDQSYYLGTTSIALNRASGAQTLNGVSIDGNAATATNISGGTAGQILYQSAANTTSKLPVGTNGQVLTLAAGVPTWATASGTGDMLKATYDANSDNIVDVAATSTNISGGTAGQILYQSAANTTSKLPVGTDGQVLTLAGGVPTWAAGGGGGGSTLYSADGTITADRTVTQAANVDLTFANSGTGRTVMDGALQINGTMYITSYRVATNLAEAAVRDTDYIIEIQISGAQTLTSVLPDPTTVPVGRVIVFRNSSARAGTGGNYTFGAPDSGYIVAATVIINSNLSMTLVCDGSKWVRIWE